MMRQDLFLNLLKPMKKPTIAKVTQDTLKIEAVLKCLTHGEFISYTDIQAKSGVEMDNKGKSYLRTALKRLKLEYSTVIGEGVELEGKDNQTANLSVSVIKMDKAIKRTNKKFKRAPEKPYFKDQTVEDKTYILTAGSVLQTLVEGSKKTKVFFPKPNTKRISN